MYLELLNFSKHCLSYSSQILKIIFIFTELKTFSIHNLPQFCIHFASESVEKVLHINFFYPPTFIINCRSFLEVVHLEPLQSVL